jgi:hypothetical protein
VLTAVALFALGAAAGAENVEGARQRLAKLARGESVIGGFGKKLDFIAAMKAEGITTRQMMGMVLLTKLTEEEVSDVVGSTRVAKAHERAIDREVRRLLREKRLPAP